MPKTYLFWCQSLRFLIGCWPVLTAMILGNPGCGLVRGDKSPQSFINRRTAAPSETNDALQARVGANSSTATVAGGTGVGVPGTNMSGSTAVTPERGPLPELLGAGLNEIEMLSFDARAMRVAHLLDLLPTSTEFAEMKQRQGQLGGFDFSAGKAWDPSWNSGRIRNCQESLMTMCRGPRFSAKFPDATSNPDTLFSAAYSRLPEAAEKEAFLTLSKTDGLDTASRLALACVSVVCSVEFNSLATAAKNPDGRTSLVLRLALPTLVGRSPTRAETDVVNSKGAEGLRSVLSAALRGDDFAELATRRFQAAFGINGNNGTIDAELPGNIVRTVIRQRQPWSQILTSDTCFGTDDKPTACDSGSPRQAGVLTTRGYLSHYAGRFNLKRARAMMSQFTCRDYPIPVAIETPAIKEQLIPMFRAQSLDEQKEPGAKNGFGNGAACYTCHSHFSLHAQLFVKFDSTGVYRTAANGLQGMGLTLGETGGGLYASHFVQPAQASNESSNLFNSPVSDLAEAGAVLARSEDFATCTIRRSLVATLGIGKVTADAIPASWYKRVVERIGKPFNQATYDEILIAALTEDEFLKGPTP